MRKIVLIGAGSTNFGLGIPLNYYPASSFGSLLNNQVGTIRLTTQAVLNKSKHSAYLTMLEDPIVNNALTASKLLDNIIDLQKNI